MTNLINAKDLSCKVSYKVLFESLCLTINKGSKLGLLGPNGAGKSTLIRLLTKDLEPCSGHVSHKKDLRVYLLEQHLSFKHKNVFDELFYAFSPEELSHVKDLKREVETALYKLGFTELEQSPLNLSGGWQKRLALAKVLLLQPELLILDEPTNHLDLDSILWLERFLHREIPSYIIVSHDRYFLNQSCEETLEINPLYPNGYFFSAFSYESFLEKKAQHLQALDNQFQALKSKSKKESHFLQSNAKARTTKSRSRTEAAQKLLRELHTLKSKRKALNSNPLSFQGSDKQSKVLFKINGAFGIEDMKITRDLRLGILGPNACGKSTFLKSLMGQFTPSKGTIKPKEDLKIAFLSQTRQELQQDVLLKDALCERGEELWLMGKWIHVNRAAQMLGFASEQLEQKVSLLSGGEQAKILLARLLGMEAELIILDEPTNDLDIETIEWLEESLINFPGAVICVSHDRFFLDCFSNLLMSFKDYQALFFASYGQYQNWLQSLEEEKSFKSTKKIKRSSSLNNQEKKELKDLPGKIVELEKRVTLLEKELLAQGHDHASIEKLSLQMAQLTQQLEQAFERWEELEAKKTAS